MPIPNQMAKKMQQGQLESEQLIRVRREDSLQLDSVSYTFSNGFSIISTVNGVSFAGSSTTYNKGQLHQVKKYLRYAEKISEALILGEGIIPEAELSGALKLRERVKEGDYTVWYQGHRPEYEMSHYDRIAAVRSVRAKWITMYGSKTS